MPQDMKDPIAMGLNAISNARKSMQRNLRNTLGLSERLPGEREINNAERNVIKGLNQISPLTVLAEGKLPDMGNELMEAGPIPSPENVELPQIPQLQKMFEAGPLPENMAPEELFEAGGNPLQNVQDMLQQPLNQFQEMFSQNGSRRTPPKRKTPPTNGNNNSGNNKDKTTEAGSPYGKSVSKPNREEQPW